MQNGIIFLIVTLSIFVGGQNYRMQFGFGWMNGFFLERYNMCMLRLFYENSDGTMGWAEWLRPYGEKLQAEIDHWKIGGRMVITEHIDLV